MSEVAYPLTLYVDDACPLCHAEMSGLAARDAGGCLRMVPANFTFTTFGVISVRSSDTGDAPAALRPMTQCVSRAAREAGAGASGTTIAFVRSSSAKPMSR